MEAPNLSLSDVKEAAKSFLTTHHPDRVLPVPIEEIAELGLRIKIIVIPGTKDLLGIDAFISADFNQITIDEYSYSNHLKRTRFSIAHEIGHLILHKTWYEQNGPKSIEEFSDFTNKLDIKTYKYLEIQANTFAGLVLVPRDELLRELENRLGKVPNKESPEVLSSVAHDLTDLFQVSDYTLFIRMQAEEIVNSLDIR